MSICAVGEETSRLLARNQNGAEEQHSRGCVFCGGCGRATE